MFSGSTGLPVRNADEVELANLNHNRGGRKSAPVFFRCCVALPIPGVVVADVSPLIIPAGEEMRTSSHRLPRWIRHAAKLKLELQHLCLERELGLDFLEQHGGLCADRRHPAKFTNETTINRHQLELNDADHPSGKRRAQRTICIARHHQPGTAVKPVAADIDQQFQQQRHSEFIHQHHQSRSAARVLYPEAVIAGSCSIK